MCFEEFPVFQTINEAKIFCQQHSREENRLLLFRYIRKQEPLFTEIQRWGAPSICHLQYLLNGLYDLDAAYSRYGELSLLEKHGVAHLIISLSAPYFEISPAIILARPKTVPVQYIVYMSVNKCGRNTDKDRKVWIFNPRTCEKKLVREKFKADMGIDELKIKLQNELGCGENMRLSEKNFLEFDSDCISYLGNYIHQKVKDKMGNKKEWKQIKVLRNRLAHPHEGISELDLKKACELLCEKSFIEDIEALVFLLSPLLPEERQMFCQHGYHNNKEKVVETMHIDMRIVGNKKL